MNLRECVQWGTAQLAAGPHPAKAAQDAEFLLLHHLGKDRAWLVTHREENFAGCVFIGYAELVRRRLTGEPVQYITGICEFYGLPFRVTRDVLIPRPETEFLVEAVLEIAPQFQAPRILDVGTGSGAIAVAIAHALPAAEVTASDISSAALAVAQDNAARNQVRIHFVEGDLLAPCAQEKFDIIASNPPYVPLEDRATLDPEVRDFEPETALFGGLDGFAIYHRLVHAAQQSLVPGGVLVLEMGHGQRDKLAESLVSAGFSEIEVRNDLQAIPRIISARRR